jgi:peptidoglycan hydrolase-like protein with peptidoglycan-binding domain
VAKIEERVDKIEEADTKLEDKLQTTEGKPSFLKKIDKIETSKKIIRFPSNEDIQIALKNAGFYDGEIDGQIGTKTRNAIKEFQKQNDLEVDGVVGRNTWEVLGRFYDMPAKDTLKPEAKDLEKDNVEKEEIKEEINPKPVVPAQTDD